MHSEVGKSCQAELLAQGVVVNLTLRSQAAYHFAIKCVFERRET